MLDTIFKEKGPNVDWVYIQKTLNKKLTKFLNFWVPFIVFITPLTIFSYGYSQSKTRAIVFFVAVAIGWIVWLMRAVVARDSIQWTKSSITLPAFIMIIAIFVTSYFSFGIKRVFGLDGIIDSAGPLSWISLIGLMLLIVQYARASMQRLQTIFISYFASSSILALIAICSWIFSGSHMMLFHGSLPSQAIWFTMNFVMIVVWLILTTKKPYIHTSIPLISIILHLIILITYNYATAWILLIAGLLMLVITQIILQRIFFQANFVKLFFLIAFCAVMIFIPKNFLPDRMGWENSSLEGIGPIVSWQRYQSHVLPTKGVFGVGLGNVTQDFWQKAELVDVRTFASFPLVSSGYVSIFWEAGFIFVFGFIALIILSIIYVLRLLKRFSRRTIIRQKHTKEKFSNATSISLIAFLGLILWIISFALVPISSIMLLTFGLLAGIISSISIDSENTMQNKIDPRGVRVWQFAGNRIQVISARFVFLCVLVFFIISFSCIASRAKAFHDFQNSIVSSSQNISMDIEKASDIIIDNPKIDEFKIVRIDFVSQSIIKMIESDPTISFDQIQNRLKILKEDLQSIEKNNISPWQAWQTAWNIEQMGAILSKIPALTDKDEQELSDPLIWFDISKDYYNQAIATLPRNVILFTDVARFLRMVSSLKDDAQKEEYLKIADELTDKAIDIDNTYMSAFLEKAEIYVLLGRQEESLNFIRAFVGQSDSIAYRAGRIAFASQKFDEAASFYSQAIEQNSKHLQARYDIIQSYIALTNLEQARTQFNELRSMVPLDDIQTHQFLDELEELIGE